MPWTFAHPAAILPLRGVGRWRLPLAALVVGSLTPDLGYYFGQFQLATFAHSTLGIPLVCLPAGALLLVLFAAVRHDLIRLLPQPHRHALVTREAEGRKTSRLGRLLGAAAGLLIGAATHTVWDSFTHASGLMVQLLPALQAPAFIVGARQLYMFNLLQHASTVLGVVAIVVMYLRWLNLPRPSPALNLAKERTRYIILFGCLALSCAAGMFIAAAAADTGNGRTSFDYFSAVISTTNTLVVLLVVSAWAWRKCSDA